MNPPDPGRLRVRIEIGGGIYDNTVEGPAIRGILDARAVLEAVFKIVRSDLIPVPPSEPRDACPRCGLPPVMPEQCTPELGAVLDQHLQRDSELFEAGRQHGKRFATDEEFQASAKRVLERHRSSLEQLADGPPSEPRG